MQNKKGLGKNFINPFYLNPLFLFNIVFLVPQFQFSVFSSQFPV